MGATVTALERQRKIDAVQDARRAARHAKRHQPKQKKSTEAGYIPVSGEEALHALYGKALQIFRGLNVAITPDAAILGTREYKRAMRLHGEDAAKERIEKARYAA